MTGISSHTRKLTPVCLLQTEKIAAAVISYVFKMAFPASLFIMSAILSPQYLVFGGQQINDVLVVVNNG